MSNMADISGGIAYVVTDLHGEALPYIRYRDHFLSLRQRGQADILIFLGDVIHGYGRPEEDSSLDMILDIMRLQSELGPQTIMMLLGNHEFPHIYGVTLSKGAMEFTSRFESILGDHRAAVIEFFKSLPFCARTPGGTLLTHAGPAGTVSTAQAARQILDFSHDALLAEADRLMNRQDVMELIQSFMQMTVEEYDRAARHHLAVPSSDDPRYLDLLRGLIASNLHEWQPVWDYLFNQCEAGLSMSFYRQVVERYLSAYGSVDWPLRVIVTGHMAVRNGFEAITDSQLRLASWSHSTPKEAGRYLLFDVTQPVDSARDLVPCLFPMP